MDSELYNFENENKIQKFNEKLVMKKGYHNNTLKQFQHISPI